VDVSVFCALSEIKIESLAGELAWFLEGIVVWEIKTIVVDGDLVIFLDKEGVVADSHAHIWLRIEAHRSKFSKDLRGNFDSYLRFGFDEADDRFGKFAFA
jgi:hypothetical protein